MSTQKTSFIQRKEVLKITTNVVYNKDGISLLKELPNESVNMILCDLPYKETGNKWDILININEFFTECRRVLKEDGAIILTGTFKFGVQLYNAAPDLYKYDWVWEKDNGTNAPNVNLQPFRIHEYVFVFGKGRVTNGTRTPMKYHPQKTDGQPYIQSSGRVSENWKGGLKNIITKNEDGKRHPKTIQKWVRDKGLHPTQKPVEMFKYFINTYTDENDVVVDICAGSGTTAIAALDTNRRYIVNDIEEKYFNIINERIKKHRQINGFSDAKFA